MSRLHRFHIQALEPIDAVTRIDRRSCEILAGWDGYGEVASGRNNESPWLSWMRAQDGTGLRADVRGAWCAALQSSADAIAARELGYSLPYRTSRSAKRYVRRVASAGEWVAQPRGPWGRMAPTFFDEPHPGDRVCWHRGDPSRIRERWLGHVARVVQYDAPRDILVIREGNRNNRRSWDGRRYAVVGLREIHHWRRRLYGIARLR